MTVGPRTAGRSSPARRLRVPSRDEYTRSCRSRRHWRAREDPASGADEAGNVGVLPPRATIARAGACRSVSLMSPSCASAAIASPSDPLEGHADRHDSRSCRAHQLRTRLPGRRAARPAPARALAAVLRRFVSRAALLLRDSDAAAADRSRFPRPCRAPCAPSLTNQHRRLGASVRRRTAATARSRPYRRTRSVHE